MCKCVCVCTQSSNMCKIIRFCVIVTSLQLLSAVSSYIIDHDNGHDRANNNLDEEVKAQIREFIHSGIYTHANLDPTRSEVIFPVKVDRHGTLLSHDPSHAHESMPGERKRIRRSAFNEHIDAPTLHYNITVEGRELRLDLRPSISFINPSMVIEHRTKNERTMSKVSDVAAVNCHYKGAVRGQSRSSVALSACDGMTGLLRTHHGEYWIEPSNYLPEDPSEARPHIIYKRSALTEEQTNKRKRRSLEHPSYREYGREYLEERRRISNKDHISKIRNNNTFNNNNYKSNRRNSNELRRNRLESQKYNLSKSTKRNMLESPKYRNKKKWESQMSKTDFERPRKTFIDTDAHFNDNHHSYRNYSTVLKRLKGSKSFEQSLERKRNRTKEKMISSKKNKIRSRMNRLRRNCGTHEPRRDDISFEQRRRQALAKRQRIISRRRAMQKLKYNARHSKGRGRRSISKPRHVEVMLAADPSMAQFHEKGKLETYLLTIMNVVSRLYSDPSIGNYIKVVVVRIVVLGENTGDLQIDTNADSALTSFCTWQHRNNPSNDTNPHHHDVAILITRMDLCSNKDPLCSTLGVAHVGGMCQPYKSCSVNQDNGISLAHTITHELGHNFNLFHDTEKIGCHPRDGSTLHIMTPIFESDIIEVAWSKCSQRDVTTFLDSGMGDCLEDTPTQGNYIYPTQPPGVLYDATKQCIFQFSQDDATVCLNYGDDDICQGLWCQVNGKCVSKMRPPADGTSCGEDMWCQKNTCVPRSPPPKPVDGGWGPWGDWGACSRVCGAGISIQSRQCDSPVPRHGGEFCVGERSRYKVCNTNPCPRNEPSFRQVQCSKYDNTEYENATVATWLPYFDTEEPCTLFCTTPNQSKIVPFGEYALDGTPCNPGTNDMCISNTCRKVGCDWIVDSNKTVDACGVCGGDGSDCETVQGIYSKGDTKKSGYSEVAVIPAGSRNVKVEEITNSMNYIGIGNAGSAQKKLYLNGKRNQTGGGTEYFVAGSPAVYEKDRDSEKIVIPGPIKEDITVYQMIYSGNHRNPGVKYQYTVDKEQAEAAKLAAAMHQKAISQRRQSVACRWVTRGFTPCSATCEGTRRNVIQCIDNNERVVSDECCSSQSELSRPGDLVERCSPQCSFSNSNMWWLGHWSACNVRCIRKGVEAYRRRAVYCVDMEKKQILDEKSCKKKVRPTDKIPCVDIPKC